ncbi:MAG TPA: CGNR zinc finger domain-containing protein [Gaiellaceae bacterium]
MPRYDVPKAAPEPLRAVQQFINSADVENERDWLPEWLERYSLQGELERARELREALRALALANNAVPLDPAAVAVVNAAAARLSIGLDDHGHVGVRTDGDEVDRILALALAAMLDGSWERLKACRNCRWSFYDYSPNRSATWCSMQLCGNRKKTRAYRRRQAGG